MLPVGRLPDVAGPNLFGQAHACAPSTKHARTHLKASTLPTDTVHCAATIAQNALLRAKSAHGTSCSRSAGGAAAGAATTGATPSAASAASAAAGAVSSRTSGCQPSSHTKPREPKIQNTLSQPKRAMSMGQRR